MTTLLWNPAAGHLCPSAALMEQLGYPDALHIAARADGMMIWACSADDLVQDGVVIATTGEDGADLLDADPIQLPVSPEQAQQLRLPAQPQSYQAWIEPDDEGDDALYAIPDQNLLPNDDGQVAVSLLVHERDRVILEALALRHGIRLTDILTAFTEDLAAYYAHSLEERYARSGGSDERQLADDWFQRNVDPTGSWLEGHSGPVFLRGCGGYDGAAGT